MQFIADFHVHSKFSRATARNLDLENLHIAAQLKGVTVVGTGDFTHPGWMEELKTKLVPAEPGLLRLRDEIAENCNQQVPVTCRRPVRFMLASEISNIYKKNGRTRKNHNLVCVPDLPSADRLRQRLAFIGNVASDGRPILGLDARDLLEITLEVSEQAYLIPAHIWTPWFSLLGSKSGFDSVAECFEDLAPHIFAVETGLSSDPAMNWRVSSLDGMTLVSNSDAHSPMKLGREANLFDTELSFDAIRAALANPDADRFHGTIEFYPQEGKYHLDGHRKCQVRLTPEISRAHEGLCPVCGKALTLGVLHRVVELADRPEGFEPENHPPYHNLIPLADVLSELLQVGPAAKKVQRHYRHLLETVGPELDILLQVSELTLNQCSIPLLGEAVGRMRRGSILAEAGYDGEFGIIKVFRPGEMEKLLGQQNLFQLPDPATGTQSAATNAAASSPPVERPMDAVLPRSEPPVAKAALKDELLQGLNEAQQRCVTHGNGPLLISAGPGTGKTRTLTHRIVYLIKRRQVDPAQILAVTFTRKAAEEMQARLKILLDDDATLPLVATFHAFCFHVLSEPRLLGQKGQPDLVVMDEQQRQHLVEQAAELSRAKGLAKGIKTARLAAMIALAKQQVISPTGDVSAIAGDDAKAFAVVYQDYQQLLTDQNLCDYEELIYRVVRSLEDHPDRCALLQQRFAHILVDEYQDINHSQYRLLRALAPADQKARSLCVIGDPDQAIYGFRGSDVYYFQRFGQDYPDAALFSLTRNYRSTETILEASFQLIRHHRLNQSSEPTRSNLAGVPTIAVMGYASDKTEALAVTRCITELIGGRDYFDIDSGQVADGPSADEYGFGDVAVLFRTREQGLLLAATFEKAGIPYDLVSREQPAIKDLVSLFALVQGWGSIEDLAAARALLTEGLSERAFGIFANWCRQEHLALDKALAYSERLPIWPMAISDQRKLHLACQKMGQLRHAAQNLPVAEQLQILVDHTAMGSMLSQSPAREEYQRLLAAARLFGADSAGFLHHRRCQEDQDRYDARAQRVPLMTLHAAKGLEFEVVFITGCEDHYLPLRRGPVQDKAEERRLLYVGMTRAKARLYLTWAKKRRLFGQYAACRLSPFVREIEKRLIDERARQSPAHAGRRQIQLELF